MCEAELDTPTPVTERFGIPPNARLVRAAGKNALVSMDDEYDPTPDSGNRKAFLAELDHIAQAEVEEIVNSRSIRL